MASNKGYTQVPQSEQIDDDIEHPRNSPEEADDDLYTTSAPLLSSRSRGNEPLDSEPKLCWYHRLVRWRPFSRQHRLSSWQPPQKPWNWRAIGIWSLFGLLLATVIALSVSTGVLSRDLENRPRYQPSGPGHRHQNPSPGDRHGSYNGRLDFPAVYPRLDDKSSPACRRALEQQRGIRCHKKIWNRSWDNGRLSSIFDPDISLYSAAICNSICKQDINRAYDVISAWCTDEDRFDMTYQSRKPLLLLDPELESGPLRAITTIWNRVRHTCREEPTSSRPGHAHCAAIMWDDWAIIDGMNAGNLAGLAAFEKRTNQTRTDNPRAHQRIVRDSCDNAYYRSPLRSQQTYYYGPGRDSTTCDWCTMNWFERKLLGWEDGVVRDPETGEKVGLKSYLSSIERVGQRCQAKDWDRIWAVALRKYKGKGELDDDWDGDAVNEERVSL